MGTKIIPMAIMKLRQQCLENVGNFYMALSWGWLINQTVTFIYFIANANIFLQVIITKNNRHS